MFHLQNYGNETLVYDGNAYTLVPAYHAGMGTLQINATHPVQSATGQTEYYTTQLESYAMTGNINNFRQGAAALRNSRDLSKEYRDSLIASANAVARARIPVIATPSTESVGASFTSSKTQGDYESDTSADELHYEDDEPPKRQRKRPGATLRASGNVQTTGRQSRQQRTRGVSAPANQPPFASTDSHTWLGYLFKPIEGGKYTFSCTIR